MKTGHRDFRLWGSVINHNVVGVILLWFYHTLENIVQNKFSLPKYNTLVEVLFNCSAIAKVCHKSECLGDWLDHSISVSLACIKQKITADVTQQIMASHMGVVRLLT